MTSLNITQEQYDAHIRAAKAQAIRDEANKLDAWCGAQKVHTKDVSAELRNHADKLETAMSATIHHTETGIFFTRAELQEIWQAIGVAETECQDTPALIEIDRRIAEFMDEVAA